MFGLGLEPSAQGGYGLSSRGGRGVRVDVQQKGV